MKGGAKTSSGQASAELGRLLAGAGRCRFCRHAELKASLRSAFLLCRLSESDWRFSKYPRLPVHECGGYERVSRPEDPGAVGC